MVTQTRSLSDSGPQGLVLLSDKTCACTAYIAIRSGQWSIVKAVSVFLFEAVKERCCVESTCT